MRTISSLSELPDSAPCYVPGYGETTVGQVRDSRRAATQDDEWEATLEMWGDIVTRNLCMEPGQKPVPTSAIKAAHAARFHSRYGGRRLTLGQSPQKSEPAE